MMRLGFYRVHQSLVEKPLTIEKFMPLRGDVERKPDKIVWGDTPEEAMENYKNIMKLHNVKVK